MLERYSLMDDGLEPDDEGAWCLYEDAQALELRIAELEQQLKTPEQKRAEFEAECG